MLALAVDAVVPVELLFQGVYAGIVRLWLVHQTVHFRACFVNPLGQLDLSGRDIADPVDNAGAPLADCVKDLRKDRPDDIPAEVKKLMTEMGIEFEAFDEE